MAKKTNRWVAAPGVVAPTAFILALALAASMFSLSPHSSNALTFLHRRGDQPERAIAQTLRNDADKIRKQMLPRAKTAQCRQRIARLADYLETSFERRLPRHPHAESSCHVSWLAGSRDAANQHFFKPRNPPSPLKKKRATIAFIVQLFTRENREQLERLIDGIASPTHVYIFTIDPKPDDAEGSRLTALLAFIKAAMLSRGVPESRFSFVHEIDVLYTGPSLLNATLLAMSRLFASDHPAWDFCINLSGSDYPIKSPEYMSAYLARMGNVSRVESFYQLPKYTHARNVNDYLVECPEEPCGDHTLPATRLLPPTKDADCSGYVFLQTYGLRPPIQLSALFGGSAWFVLHRHFAGYVVSCLFSGIDVATSWSNARSSEEKVADDAYCESIRGFVDYFSNIWSPEELFFQTALFNGPFCDHVRGGYLRYVFGIKRGRRQIISALGKAPVILVMM